LHCLLNKSIYGIAVPTLITIPQDLTGCLVFPVSPLLYRPVETDSTWAGTIINTTATVPAFIGVQYHRRFAFLWIGYKYIYLADFHTGVTPVADIRIENYWISGADYIG
jgi:hypothetical protein